MTRINRCTLGCVLALTAAQFAAPTVGEEVAARGPVVLELFTSQGCSSCPPADALMAELAQRADVVALGLHVDYWNYLGWSDTLASAANTRRQREYAALMGERLIYTPQMVIDGATAVVGSRRSGVLDAITAAAAAPHDVVVRLRRDADMLHIAASAPPETADMVYFIYEPAITVAIAHGENAGRALTYVNPVRAWMPLERWSEGPGKWSVPLPQGAQGVAAVVQAVADGRVLGAARHDFAGAAPAAAESVAETTPD